MRFIGFFALLAVAEMATFFWVGSRIGFGWALGLAIATAVIGSILVRRSGLSVLSRIQDKMNQGRPPGRELSDGAAILVAGAFLISPGFITDTLGFLLLIPAVRDLAYRLVTKRLSGRFTLFTSSRQAAGGEWVSSDPDIIDVDGRELGD